MTGALEDKHIPSGSCYVAISHGSPNLEFFHLYREEDCMHVFVKQMETLSKDIYEKNENRYFKGVVRQAELATRVGYVKLLFLRTMKKSWITPTSQNSFFAGLTQFQPAAQNTELCSDNYTQLFRL